MPWRNTTSNRPPISKTNPRHLPWSGARTGSSFGTLIPAFTRQPRAPLVPGVRSLLLDRTPFSSLVILVRQLILRRHLFPWGHLVEAWYSPGCLSWHLRFPSPACLVTPQHLSLRPLPLYTIFVWIIAIFGSFLAVSSTVLPLQYLPLPLKGLFMLACIAFAYVAMSRDAGNQTRITAIRNMATYMFVKPSRILKTRSTRDLDVEITPVQAGRDAIDVFHK